MSGPLTYEWVRISTVRSTWALILVGALVPAALVLFVTWLVNSAEDFQGGPPDGAATTGFAGFLPLVAAILCTIGAASFGQEYRHGLIRITLATYPRRSRVFAAKTIMVVLVVILAAILAIACIVVANALGPAIAGKDLAWDTSALGPPGLRGVIYVVIFVLMAFALTALTRNQPLGIIVPVVLAVLVEPITLALVQEWTWIDWVLPFTGATAGISADGLEAWGHLGVFFLWFLVLAIPAWVLFVRRDA
ncbi:MAG: ABC transporter permease [bacterium]